jgi:hypothetical protein
MGSFGPIAIVGELLRPSLVHVHVLKRRHYKYYGFDFLLKVFEFIGKSLDLTFESFDHFVVPLFALLI